MWKIKRINNKLKRLAGKKNINFNSYKKTLFFIVFFSVFSVFSVFS